MCPADAVKPSILNINDTYYSIYGDCSVVIHFYNTIWKENLIAIATIGQFTFCRSLSKTSAHLAELRS